MKLLRRVLLALSLVATVNAAIGRRPELAVELLISVALFLGSEIEHP